MYFNQSTKQTNNPTINKSIDLSICLFIYAHTRCTFFRIMWHYLTYYNIIPNYNILYTVYIYIIHTHIYIYTYVCVYIYTISTHPSHPSYPPPAIEVVEPCFATFFLAKLLGKHNFYYDLQSLDPVAGLRKEHPGRSPKCLDERMDFETFWDSLVVFGVYIYTVYISIYPYIYIL